MSKPIFLLLTVLSGFLLYSCKGVEKSQVMGDWNLYKYESPDQYLNAYMNKNRNSIQYLITDSIAYFKIEGQEMYVSNWQLENKQLMLSPQNGGGATNWRIVKVDEKHLILRASNWSIGKRTYEFYR